MSKAGIEAEKRTFREMKKASNQEEVIFSETFLYRILNPILNEDIKELDALRAPPSLFSQFYLSTEISSLITEKESLPQGSLAEIRRWEESLPGKTKEELKELKADVGSLLEHDTPEKLSHLRDRTSVIFSGIDRRQITKPMVAAGAEVIKKATNSFEGSNVKKESKWYVLYRRTIKPFVDLLKAASKARKKIVSSAKEKGTTQVQNLSKPRSASFIS